MFYSLLLNSSRAAQRQLTCLYLDLLHWPLWAYTYWGENSLFFLLPVERTTSWWYSLSSLFEENFWYVFYASPSPHFFFVYHKEKPDYWNRFFLTVCICSYSHICVCLFQFNFMFLLLWHRPVKNDSSFKICRKIFLMSSWLNNPLKNYFLFVRHCGLPTATQYKFWEFCVLFWVWVWKEDIYFLFRADWNFFLGFKVKMH